MVDYLLNVVLYIEMNKWLIAAMHAGISRVSFIMSWLSGKRSISGRGEYYLEKPMGV